MSEEKPILFYVDDEPNNLTVFEASLPDQWEVHIFDNAMAALKKMEELKPWVIVSDQRMPQVTGVEFLELSMKIHPEAVRIICTGYSDENLVVESVRKAKVYDYIRKPWDADDLERSMEKAIEFYKVESESKRLNEELKKREEELAKKNTELLKMTNDLRESSDRESNLRKELECWVPPFVTWALKENMSFPITKDLIGVTYDIIGSGELFGVEVKGRPIRAKIIELFSELVIKHGGIRESHAGDSAYAHFGLLEMDENPFEAAFAVAREFRVALRSLTSKYNLNVECGIALHLMKNSIIELHQVQLASPNGVFTQKSFDTNAPDVDMLHRIEKITHKLPGSNIVMSKEFLNGLEHKPRNLVDIKEHEFKGQSRKVQLFLLKSDLVKEEKIEEYFPEIKKAS